MTTTFDIVLENPIDLSNVDVKTIGQILFENIPNRNEDSSVIFSHIENQSIEISLSRLRYIVFNLTNKLKEKDIRKGQTIILLNFTGCNEMYTAIYFITLASIGCCVFMPMYSEKQEFSEWIDLTKAKHIIIPEGEVLSLEGHDKEKSDINKIKKICNDKGAKIWDNLSDFNLLELLRTPLNEFKNNDYNDFKDIHNVSPDDEVLIVTTSGTSGRSRMVVYTHKAYYLNCMSWEQAGFFNPELLGGIGFTPLFTHTMGIRAFINALWTGVPVCLIITEWFFDKPEIVRHLLLKMKPAHITGGPAVYNLFMELFRIYPELKAGLSPHLKTLVSSGAKYNPVTSKAIMDATGLQLHNAFGTTETQQVFTTLLSNTDVFNKDMIPLGKPLPGVSIGLIKTDTEADHYILYVKSVFGHKYCLLDEEKDNNGYYETGDVVYLNDNEELFYSGRASQDYIKDCFGVKIPLTFLHEYYNELLTGVIHAEFYPIINFPGISALLFINDSTIAQGPVIDSNLLKRYAGIIEGINNRLINTLEAFEYQHRHICRIAVINQEPPYTGKGTVSAKKIAINYHDLIDRLSDTRKDANGIEITDKLYQITDKYTRYVSPQIGTMMTALKINYSYHKGLKDSLFTYIHGKETEILDLVGGYGTNLLGHSHPLICEAIKEFVDSGKPAICNQLSVQQTTGLLAERLNFMIGKATGKSYQVVFANSGSEAVEMALHHAYFEWKKRLEKLRDQQIQLFGSDKELNVAEVWKDNMNSIESAVISVIGISQAYHGQSTGARSLLGNEKKRKYFKQLTHIHPLFIDDREADWQDKLDAFIQDSKITINRITSENGCLKLIPSKVNTIIAAMVEPLLGEGGVREVNKDFLKQLSSYDFPLISDEIQCGLGRSGNIPENDKAHYYLFGKALGGGMEKIAAVMIDSTRFCYDFSENYVSTFSNGELAAHVALKSLGIIEGDAINKRVADAGAYLQQQLTAVRDKYPTIISDIQGKGLMHAIYFNPHSSNNKFLRVLFQHEKAGYLFGAWFLNKHQIRILPTLSTPNALRIEPSAYITKQETDKFCNALAELCQLLKDQHTYDLLTFLMDDDPFDEKQEATMPTYFFDPVLATAKEGAVKVAFIAHYVLGLKEIRMLENDLCRASDTGLRILFNRMQILLEMKPMQVTDLNLFNNKVHFSFYIIPVDSAELEYLHKSGQRRHIVSKIQDAVDLLSSQGAQIISLGGYTSILTNNGLSLVESNGARIITGNTLTAASGLMHLEQFIRKKPEFNKPNTIAIIGSTGNIGKIITKILYEKDDICSELLLVSRTEKRDIELINEILKDKNDKITVRRTDNLFEVKDADVIVICSNTNDPIIFKHHIAHNKPVLISDLSIPTAVSEEVTTLPNVTVLPFSAYVSLVEDKDAVISSFSQAGTVFCCAGEGILLALENYDGPLKGKITPEAVKEITRLASKYGFFHNINTVQSYKSAK